MEVREVRVAFKKTVSDGNYGNETYAVAFTATVLAKEDPDDKASILCELAHSVVLSHLKSSPMEGVRAALETPEERHARWKREQDEYLARRSPREEPVPPLLGDDDPF